MAPSVTDACIIVGTMTLGEWGEKMDTPALEKFIEGCLEIGLTVFDHADIYGGFTTESDFGAVLKLRPDLKDKLQIVTKCGIRMMSENRPENKVKSYDTSKDYILRSAENSLKNLNVDSIDMLLIHRPDFLMNPDEIAESFRELKASGKVKAFGVSNFTPSQFDMLNSRFPLETNQVELSLLKQDFFDDGTLDQCILNGIKPMAWSPLGGGKLFTDLTGERVKRIRAEADALCEKYNLPLDGLMYAWLMKHPAGIIPVTGTTKLDRLKTAKQALDVELSREDWYRLWSASKGHEVA